MPPVDMIDDEVAQPRDLMRGHELFGDLPGHRLRCERVHLADQELVYGHDELPRTRDREEERNDELRSKEHEQEMVAPHRIASERFGRALWQQAEDPRRPEPEVVAVIHLSV